MYEEAKTKTQSIKHSKRFSSKEQQILAGLEQAVKEVNLHKQDKSKLKNLEEVLDSF